MFVKAVYKYQNGIYLNVIYQIRPGKTSINIYFCLMNRFINEFLSFAAREAVCIFHSFYTLKIIIASKENDMDESFS